MGTAGNNEKSICEHSTQATANWNPPGNALGPRELLKEGRKEEGSTYGVATVCQVLPSVLPLPVPTVSLWGRHSDPIPLVRKLRPEP